MIASPFLAMVGSMIGRNYQLRIKQSFEQTAQLWVAVVADPGKTKSPALRAARAPLGVLQKAAKERYDGEVALYELELQEHGKKAAGARPELESLFTTNATPEALHRILQHSRGVAIVQDELAGWVRGMDAYKGKGGKSGERQTHLSAWSGEPFKVDRRRDDPIYISHPVYSVIGGIQPEMLASLDEEGKQDGFLDRFLWVVPNVPRRRWTDADVSEESLERVVSVLQRIRAGSGTDVVCDEPTIITLAPEAKQRWVAWFNQNAIQQEHVRGLLAGIYAKLPIQLARLALILHLLTDLTGRSAIGLQTMEHAIELVEFFRQEARIIAKVFQARQPQPLVEDLMDALQSKHGVWMSKTDIYNWFSRNVSATELDEALHTLREAGRAEQKFGDSAGGRKPEYWRAVQNTTANEFTNLRIKSDRGAISQNGSTDKLEETLRAFYVDKDFAGLMEHCQAAGLDFIDVLDRFEAAAEGGVRHV